MSISSSCSLFVFGISALLAASALGATARATDTAGSLSCTLSESSKRVRWNDYPFAPTDAYLCADAPLTPDEAGLVNCRVIWKLLNEPGAGADDVKHCSDYSYLSPAPFDPFATPEASSDPGDVCLVRQVTPAAADAGNLGWYYQSSAPTLCSKLGPALMLPRDRPLAVDIYAQCALTKHIADRDQVVDVDPAECVQPKSTADATDVGLACDLDMALGRQFSMDLGDQGCSSGVCLSVPLREPVCSEVNGIPRCTENSTACSCRCAGEEGDPGPFCTCPDAYECKPLVSDFAGTKDSRGSYCVPKGAQLR